MSQNSVCFWLFPPVYGLHIRKEVLKAENEIQRKKLYWSFYGKDTSARIWNSVSHNS